MKKNCLPKIISAVIFLLILVVWQILAGNPQVSFLFGSPIAVLTKLFQGTISGVLPYNFLITGVEAITGFIIGIVGGTIVGFLLWYSPFLAKVSKPYIMFLGAVPVFAFAPMIIIWFGIGISMKIALAAFAVFLVSLSQAYAGAQSVDEAEYKLLKTYGATRFQMFQKVIFPASLSWVLASMWLSIGLAILGAFVGEFISSDVGVGHIMVTAGSLYDIPSVLAGGLYLVLLSALLGFVVYAVEKNQMKIIDWLS